MAAVTPLVSRVGEKHVHFAEDTHTQEESNKSYEERNKKRAERKAKKRAENELNYANAQSVLLILTNRSKWSRIENVIRVDRSLGTLIDAILDSVDPHTHEQNTLRVRADFCPSSKTRRNSASPSSSTRVSR